MNQKAAFTFVQPDGINTEAHIYSNTEITISADKENKWGDQRKRLKKKNLREKK